jgi:hypothetical protein
MPAPLSRLRPDRMIATGYMPGPSIAEDAISEAARYGSNRGAWPRSLRPQVGHCEAAERQS